MKKSLKYAVEGLTYAFNYKNLTTGGTCDARYCYSVWMRHLIYYYEIKQCVPQTIAEFGPGDTIGIGLTALLCGVEHYYALDFARYGGMKKVDYIFSQLITLLKGKSDIPDDSEFPGIYPKLKSYRFPGNILTDEWLSHCLESARIDAIKKAIQSIKGGNESDVIHYLAPWWREDIQNIKCDMIFSQAVLEHIDDYANAHKVIGKMAKTGAVVSHQIDFSCHGCADKWNGHWAYGDLMWKMVYGSRPYFLNRMPLSVHLRECQKYGIRIVKCMRIRGENGISHKDVCRKFRNINEKDLRTRSAYILGIKMDK